MCNCKVVTDLDQFTAKFIQAGDLVHAEFAGVLSKWDADQILDQKADEFRSEL